MALTTLEAIITAQMDIKGQATADFADAIQDLVETRRITLTVGTGADQADQIWADQRTISSSSSETLAIQGGSLTNAVGQTLTLTKVKAIYVRNRSTTGDLLVGGNVTNQFDSWAGDATDKVRVRRGGVFLLAAPDATAYAVDASDVIKMENEDGANSLTYDVILVGVD